ncbi:MAG: hypothetical protein JKP98_20310 [Rhodobacteraceae bacterium]|nr:hypothetical protein [Paracoccaceae bacterium]
MRPALTLVFLAAAAGAAAQDQPVPGERFMVMWDADSDGVVSAEEARARRAMIFDMFDYEGDGVLSPEDYADIDAHIAEDSQKGAAMGGPRPDGRRMQAGISVAANDADGDGLVSLAEFLDASDAWLAGMDVNGMAG